MKKFTISVILLSVFQLSWTNLPPVSKELEQILGQKWAYISSGNSKLGEKVQPIESFYISKTEISNAEYLFFLESIKTKNSAHYYTALPDSTVWSIGDKPNKAFESQYFRYPAFKEYPVVGVSFDAALLYCKSLEENINQQIDSNEKIVVRLPTEAEWVRAARGDKHTFIFPWGGPYLENRKGRSLANYKKENLTNFKGQIITMEVKSFYPNEFGIYQMSGNVAEMLNDSKNVKGGSWTSTAQSLEINAIENIKYPANNVGFRPIILIKN